MKLRSVRYYFKEAAKSLLRNRLMTAASVLTVLSCAFILIVSFCIAANLDYVLEQIESTVVLSAFIEDELSAGEVSDLYREIIEIEHVSSIGYVSYDMALEIWRESFLDDSMADSEVVRSFEDDNPLPRSFNIKLENSAYQDGVIAELEKYIGGGFESIRHESESVNKLLSLNRGVRMAAAVIILGLAFISVIIIMNTIKLTVNIRKKEIEIMKYVGATDWFIRWPFIIEGVIIGITGALIPTAIGWLGYDRAMGVVIVFLAGAARLKSGDEIFLILAPLAASSGILIGSLGSALSMRRFLKV